MTQGTPPARTDGSKLPPFDPTVPNPARMWNYWLGGKDNFAADRQAAERVLEAMPSLPLIEGENLVVERPNRLVQTMRALWGPDAERAGTSRVTWEIEPVGDSCRLTVMHDQLPPDAPAELYGGWPMILSGLKTWLETGQTLTTPGSLMYQPQQ